MLVHFMLFNLEMLAFMLFIKKSVLFLAYLKLLISLSVSTRTTQSDFFLSPYAPCLVKMRIRTCAECTFRFIPRMRKTLSGHLLSIDTFYSGQWYCKRTANALIRLRGCAGWSGLSLFAYAQRHVFAWRGPHNVGSLTGSVICMRYSLRR